MKLKLSVFIGVVLCMLLMGVYGVLSRMFDSRDGWRPNDMYSTVAGTTYSTVSYSSGSSVSDVPAVSMRGGRSFSRRAAAPVFSYAHASDQSSMVGTASYSQSPISYAASNATVKSFGGGGNVASSVSGGAAGSAASSVAAASVAAPAGLSVSMPSTSAYAYNANRNTRSNAGDLSTLTSGEFAAASSYAGIGNTTGPRGMNGRKNVPGIGGSVWTGWLESEWAGGSDQITWQELLDLYAKMTGDTDFSNEELWNSFLSWFEGNQSNDKFGWYWQPISDAVPFMLLLCLMYAFVIYRKMAKKTKTEN